jgi:regulator of sigma E protease
VWADSVHEARDPLGVATAVLLPGLGQPAALQQALYREANLDPLRLPDQLRQWARSMADRPKEQRVVHLQLRRHNQKGGPHYRQVEVSLPWDYDWTYDDLVPISHSSPWAIPELGLGYEVKATVAGVAGPAPADPDAALKPGDVIEEVRFHTATDTDEPHVSDWFTVAFTQPDKFQEPDRWAYAYHRLQSGAKALKVDLKVKRGKETKEITLTPREDTSWPFKERGLLLFTDSRLEKADGFFEAVGMGFKDAKRSMDRVYLTLRGMIIGRIGVDNLGGPLTIGKTAYDIAGIDFWEFLFFLGLISINLAVINFLPIPVLDGGHMVFLAYEKIRGKPASEGVRIGATYAGLLVLASLMIFVIFLDIRRFIFG